MGLLQFEDSSPSILGNIFALLLIKQKIILGKFITFETLIAWDTIYFLKKIVLIVNLFAFWFQFLG